MQLICKEEWEVSTGKKNFPLNNKQMALLKEASGRGETGLIWFKDFVISISHIVHITRTSRIFYKEEDGVSRVISKTEYEEGQKQLGA